LNDDRPDPRPAAGERELLETFLDFHRATLLQKTDGLDEAGLRQSPVPSGTSLLGMVKHVAYVERWWFQAVFAGDSVDFPWTDEDPDADWRIEADESPADIFALYRGECARNRQISAASALDEVAANSSKGFTLRWILVHMIEETARHNGHADILRELADGTVGE
jgi:uncharacterized damage-inducible protein DinB